MQVRDAAPVPPWSMGFARLNVHRGIRVYRSTCARPVQQTNKRKKKSTPTINPLILACRSMWLDTFLSSHYYEDKSSHNQGALYGHSMFHRKDLLLWGGVYGSREIEFLKKIWSYLYVLSYIYLLYLLFFRVSLYIREREWNWRREGMALGTAL